MCDLVEICNVHPRIYLEILYATSNNFTGKIVYPSSRCFLRKKTAERLARVQNRLEKEGLGLKVWDGYRPLSVQKIFWSICPNPQYVANPAEGSKHNRGAAVDLTLVDTGGRELPMPTGFDDFTEKASHAYTGCSQEEMKNRERLKAAMSKEGFLSYSGEWWHYDDPEWETYPILDVDFEELDQV